MKVLGAAEVRGFEGGDLRNPQSILACAKHFAGDGGTTFGTGALKSATGTGRWPLDRGDTRIDEAALRRIHLAGYVTAIRAGVGSIMASFNSWNGVKCSASYRLLTEILKGKMRFEGFVVSDWAAIEALPGDYNSQVERTPSMPG